MNSEQLTPSQETGAVSTDCKSSPLGIVGPTELEAPPKGHAVPQQAPLTVRSGSQLSVDSKQLRAFLRSNTVATPRMYSMEQHHHHRHHHCHHNLHLGRRNV